MSLTGINWTSEHPRFVADVTGDGKADIIGCGLDGLWVAVSDGQGNVHPPRHALDGFVPYQGWRTDRHPRTLAELNRARLPFPGPVTDVSTRRAAGALPGSVFPANGLPCLDFLGFGDDGVWTAISNGDGTFQEAKFVLANLGFNQGWRVDQHPRFLADITGGGKAAIIAFGNDGVWTAISNGDGSFQEAKFVLANLGFNQGWRVDQHPRFLADLTGDGKADIIAFGDDGVWTAISNGDGTFQEAKFVLADFGLHSADTGVKHIFVLMLENRSFDHFLGFSGITGTDITTGKPTTIAGLQGNESNSFGGNPPFLVSTDAPDRCDAGTPHDFKDVLIQLCGEQFKDKQHLNGASYPAVKGSGYAAAYAFAADSSKPGEIMRCFSRDTLPVLTQLAEEFAVCDHWFSSMAGPTEPNRMFVHAATSGDFDDSPSASETAGNELFDGLEFDDGTIYDRLRKAGIPFAIYSGDGFPNVALLDSISLYTDVRDFDDFADDLNDDDGYDPVYTFIEPNYDAVELDKFREGDSQHPPGSVAAGEQLIKTVYETLRASPVWDDSMLVVVWDEHGGFYDHVLPPRAKPTGKRGRDNGFMFDQLGPRVPAVVISPLIPRNAIEHRTLEHSVIPASLEQMFGMDPMTVRDASIIGLQSLATLKTPRADTPRTLREPVVSSTVSAPRPVLPPAASTMMLNEIRDDNVFSLIRLAIKGNLELTPGQSAQIKAHANSLQTLGDALAFVSETSGRLISKRKELRATRNLQRGHHVHVP